MARFDCTTWAVHEGGDHWVIFGEVQGIERENKEGLVFSDGSYATANPVRQMKAVEAGAVDYESPIDNLLIYNLARAYRQMSSQFHDSVRDSGLSIPAGEFWHRSMAGLVVHCLILKRELFWIQNPCLIRC